MIRVTNVPNIVDVSNRYNNISRKEANQNASREAKRVVESYQKTIYETDRYKNEKIHEANKNKIKKTKTLSIFR